MESIQFKTNIKCDACIAKVTPGLNEAIGADNWQVDITNPSKILTISDEQKEAKVKEALAKVGYKAERI
jgi:copper chaperone